MTEAEEPPILSFKDRIAKFNQPAEKPPVPRPQPKPAPRPAAVAHGKTSNNPPGNANGSVLDRAPIGNQPAAPEQRQNGANYAENNVNGVQKPTKVAPPLPSRKTPPALPHRPSESPSLQRRNSPESTASENSLSTVSTRTGRTTGTGASSVSGDSSTNNSRVRAPAYNEAELPPLPPRRGKSPMPPSHPPSRPLSSATNKELVEPPRLPHRSASNTSVSTTDSGRAPAPPPRLPLRTPPRTPSRGSHQEPTQNGNGDARPPLPTRRLPPPPSSTDARQFGFSGMNGTTNGHSTPNDAGPPPVPTASRPDLSKIQASKPRIHASHPSYAPAPSTGCLKCRDFSGPDTHAARYPRELLPSHNLPWLANELAAPFPSPTDKARAIFTWLHHNIEYDVHAFYNNCVKPSTPANTIATGLAVCEGYAGLFAALATHAGLEAIVVSGHGKGVGYSDPAAGSSLPPFSGNHAWNVVRIDNGQWKLIDSCWGAGSVQGPGIPYQKHLSPEHFIESNDEFGMRHYPANRDQFYRDDGRPGISWEEYMLGNPHSPIPTEQPIIFTDAHKHSIGPRSFRPATKHISINQGGPIRVQFSLICEHWTLERHSKAKPGLFLLMIHGIDGRNDDRLPFHHFRGYNSNGGGGGGGGDIWYVDVPDSRMLGAPGQVLQIAVLSSFGGRGDARGLTVQEYQEQVGRVGMAWAYVAQWDLVA